MTRARSSLLVALGCLFLAAACGNDEPQAVPSSPPGSSSVVETSSPAETSSPVESSTSASPTANPTPTIDKPTLPPEAEVQDSSGATAFFEYFWEQYNYAHATGESDAFAELSEPDCVFCSDVITTLESLQNDGGRNVGGEITVRDASAPPGDPADGFLVTAVLDQSAGQVLDSEGEVVGEGRELQAVRADAAIVQRGHGWSVVDLSLEFKEDS